MEYGYPANFIMSALLSRRVTKKRNSREFSSNSYQVDVIASGVDVLSTYPTNKYAVLSGTSMATPHVSGALALIINLRRKVFRDEL